MSDVAIVIVVCALAVAFVVAAIALCICLWGKCKDQLTSAGRSLTRSARKAKPNVYDTKFYDPRTGRSVSNASIMETGGHRGDRPFSSRLSTMSSNIYASLDQLNRRAHSLDRDKKKRLSAVSQSTYPSSPPSKECLSEDIDDPANKKENIYIQPLIRGPYWNSETEFPASERDDRGPYKWHRKRKKRRKNAAVTKAKEKEPNSSCSSDDERPPGDKMEGGPSCENLLEPSPEDIRSVPSMPVDEGYVRTHRELLIKLQGSCESERQGGEVITDEPKSGDQVGCENVHGVEGDSTPTAANDAETVKGDSSSAIRSTISEGIDNAEEHQIPEEKGKTSRRESVASSVSLDSRDQPSDTNVQDTDHSDDGYVPDYEHVTLEKNGTRTLDDSLDHSHGRKLSETFDKMIPTSYRRFSSEEELSAAEDTDEVLPTPTKPNIGKALWTKKFSWDISDDDKAPPRTPEKRKGPVPYRRPDRMYETIQDAKDSDQHQMESRTLQNAGEYSNRSTPSSVHMVDNIIYESAGGREGNHTRDHREDNHIHELRDSEDDYELRRPEGDTTSVLERMSIIEHWEEDSVFAGLHGDESRAVTEDEAHGLEYDYEDLARYRREPVDMPDITESGEIKSPERTSTVIEVPEVEISDVGENEEMLKFYKNVKETMQMIHDESFVPNSDQEQAISMTTTEIQNKSKKSVSDNELPENVDTGGDETDGVIEL
ncbi:uncharacterized protein [Ptychodera flava]|uniref:uncharacterized protein n=1 Tax=Ptychodera flava TaxID=63121 RepID=UPI00396A9883